jgi:AraC-like DNA-binding protein
MGIWVSRRKTKAETADILTQAAERVTKLLTDQLMAASKDVKELRDQLSLSSTQVSNLVADVENLTRQVYLLRQALISLGGDPDTVIQQQQRAHGQHKPRP